MKISPRFLSAIVVLGATAIFLQGHVRSEVFPPRRPLSDFPAELDNRVSRDVPLPQDTLDILGNGDFLLRVYMDKDRRRPYIDMFLAYFPSQRAGDTIHSPRHCLPGAGWLPVESSRIEVSVAGHAPFPANRYLIAKGPDRQLVLYWFWAHDRGVASEYWAKYYLVADSIHTNRSDGSLVRLTTPMAPGEKIESAQQRLLAFAGDVVPVLNDYVPR
jgi:EpsI family protein